MLMVESSKPVYNGLQSSKKQKKNKKNMDDEPVGRMYKKTKAERGVKRLPKERVGGKSKVKASNTIKRKGKPKGRK